MVLQLRQAPRGEGRVTEVVVRLPIEVISPGVLEDELEIPGGPDVGVLSDIAYARIPPGIAFTDLAGSIGGGVVGDEDLQVRMILGQQGVQGVGQVHLPIEDGDADAHQRRVLEGHEAPITGCRGWKTRPPSWPEISIAGPSVVLPSFGGPHPILPISLSLIAGPGVNSDRSATRSTPNRLATA